MMAKMGNVEKKWERNGLECKVLTHTILYHRCGYVEVPENHPMYGKDYGEAPWDWHDAVNGGLTFSDSVDGKWMVGFDCGHCGDAPDISLIDDEGERARFAERNWHLFPPENHIWTLEEVERQVNALADLVGGES